MGQTYYRNTNVRLMPLTIVIIYFNSLATAEKSLRLSTEEVHVYTNGRDIDDYDIMSPEYLDASVMTKRSVDSQSVVNGDLLVKFHAFGEDYLVHLQPNSCLMRQDLVIETLGEDGVITVEGSPNTACHYFARLSSHTEESEGALSTCDGLRGIITHGDSDIYIEPLKDNHASRLRRDVGMSTQDRAHIVYKRTANSPRSHQSPFYGSSSSNKYFEDEYSEFDEDSNGQHEANVGCDNDTEPENFCSPARPPGYNPYRTGQNFEPFSVDPNLGKSALPNDGESLQQQREDLVADQPRFEDFRQTVTGQRYIEIFLLIDRSMVEFHGDDTLNYTMSLMNIVSRRYSATSLRAQIRLVLVRVLVLTTDTPWMIGHDGTNRTMIVSGNGDEVMGELCDWQSHFNPVGDDDPGHWDTAILITRLDLYTMQANNRKSFTLLGRAYVGTICDGEWSCSVNQDDGLPSGMVITHELGHSLSLSHDPIYGCQNGRNIMSAVRPTGIHAFHWSRCSGEYMSDFLNSDASRCLLDEPAIDDLNVQLLPWDRLPGARYDRLAQCQKAHGPRVTQFCSMNRPRTCGNIGCLLWGHCAWIQVMEGTSCGVNRWCLVGHCKSSIGGVPAPIDGGWSEWEGSFATCSKTCGTGVVWRRRYCNHPAPRHGGRGCPGESAIMRLCNTEPCLGISTSDDFRREECTATDSVRFRNQIFSWEPNYSGRIDGNELCTLACKTMNGQYFANRAPNKFVDGLQCWKYGNDPNELRRTRICVDRQCVEFGCDGIYGSGKIKDVCGKCEGTNRTCTHVSGSITDRLPRHRRWHELFVIPEGSVGINITNTNMRYCTLALSYGGVSVFRPRTLDRAPDYRYTVDNDTLIVHNTKFYDWEKIWVMSGPTRKEIKVEGQMDWPSAIFGPGRNPNFTWEWYEPTTLPVSYYWRQTILTECPVTCGGGNMTADIYCVEEVDGVPMNVSHRLCDDESKPAEYPPCNTQFCPGLMWLVGEWTECSVTCGTGQNSRTVDCIEGSTLQPAPTIDCIMHCCYRPNVTMKCDEEPCPTTTFPTTLEITTQDDATTNLEGLTDATVLGLYGTDITGGGVDVNMSAFGSTKGNIGTTPDASTADQQRVTSSAAGNPLSSIPKGHANGMHPRLRDQAFLLFLNTFMRSLK